MEADVEREASEAEPVAETVRDLRQLPGPQLSFELLYPDVLGDEYDDRAFARAETPEEALKVFEDMYGVEWLETTLGPGWRQMAPELVERWLKPEPADPDSYYCQEAMADGDPNPLWWVPAEEGEAKAVRYWAFEP